MSYTPFEGLSIAIKVLGEGGAYAAAKIAEDKLKLLQICSIEGIPLLNISKNENIIHDNQGNIVIVGGKLEENYELYGETPIYFRNYQGEFQSSLDQITWQAVGTAAGAVYMLESVYDTDADGRVEAADELTDGTNTVNPSELRDHLDSHPGITDHTLLSNIGTKTHAQIDSHLAEIDSHIPPFRAAMLCHNNGATASAESPLIGGQSDLSGVFSIVWAGELWSGNSGDLYSRKNESNEAICVLGLTAGNNLKLTIGAETITSTFAVPTGYQTTTIECGVCVDVPNNQAWFFTGPTTEAAQAITITFPTGNEYHKIMDGVIGGVFFVGVTPALICPANSFRFPVRGSRSALGVPSHFYSFRSEGMDGVTVQDFSGGGQEIPLTITAGCFWETRDCI